MHQKQRSQKKETNQNSVRQTLKELVLFLKSVHGIFVVATISFEILNVFLNAIPLEKAEGNYIIGIGHGLANFTPEFVTTITFIITLFAIVYQFGERYKYLSNPEKYGYDYLKRSSIYLLVVGISLLVSYMYIYTKMIASYKLDFLLSGLYIIAFVSIAISFMRLAMIEYYSLNNKLFLKRAEST